MKRRMMSILLCAVMVAGAVPGLAMPVSAAGDTYKPYGDVLDIEVGGEKYFDIYGTEGERSDIATTIYRNTLESQMPDGKGSVANHWDRIAQVMYANSTRKASGPLDDLLLKDAYYKLYEAPESNRMYYYGDAKDFWSGTAAFNPNLGVQHSPIMAAKNLEEVKMQIKNNIKNTQEKNTQHFGSGYVFNANDYCRNDINEKIDNAGIGDKDFYLVSTSTILAEHGGNNRNSFQNLSWGAIYYDFGMTYLETGKSFDTAINQLPEGDGNTELYDALQKYKEEHGGTGIPGISYTIPSAASGSEEYTVGAKNGASKAASLSTAYGSSTTESYTNTRSHTEEYSLGESLNIGVEFESGFITKLAGTAKYSMNVGFQSSQMWNDTWENSSTYEKTSNNESSTSIELPAHTQLMMTTSKAKSSIQMDYDYPVVVTYKVLLYGYYGVRTTEQKLVQQTFELFNSFGGQAGGEHIYAAGNLKNRIKYRAQPSYDVIYGNSQDWNALADSQFGGWDNAPLYVNLLDTCEQLGYNQPYTATGATMDINSVSTNTEIYEIQPLYPLRKIRTESAADYQMTIGDNLYTDNIPLIAENGAGVEYYGFDADAGSWKIVDEDGKPMTDSPVLSLVKNKNTGYTKLNATGKGDAYISYFMDEDTEYTSGSSASPATNDSVARVAIPIHVSEKPFTGSITITGDLSMPLGDEAVAIDQKLSTKIEDSNGTEITRALTWQAKELNGVTISKDQKISFTKPGTYHICATAGDVRSDWKEVTCTDARALQKIVIDTESVTLDMKSLAALPKAQIAFTGYDQYGDKFAVTDPEFIFNVPRAVSYDDVAMQYAFLKTGNYELVLQKDGIVSGAMPVIVEDSRSVAAGFEVSKITLPCNRDDAERTVIFKVTGEGLSDGMEIALSEGGTILKTTGTDTEQTAEYVAPYNTDTENAHIITAELVSVKGVKPLTIEVLPKIDARFIDAIPEPQTAGELYTGATLTLTAVYPDAPGSNTLAFDHWEITGDAKVEDEHADGTMLTVYSGKISVTAKLRIENHEHQISDYWVTNGTYHWHECTTGGCDYICDKAAHSGGTATCKDKAECEICKQAYGKKDPANHVEGTELQHALEATTLQEGYSGDLYCTGCGNLLAQGEAIPKVHRHVLIDGWTSDEAGHWHACENCQDKVDYEVHVPGPAATEDSDQICQICKRILVPKLGHIFKKVTIPATCTEAGMTRFTCECGEEYATPIAPLGHIGGIATCTKKAVCTRCKKEYGSIDSSNHVNTTLIKEKKATSHAEGYTGDLYCRDCKRVLKKGKVLAKTEPQKGEKFNVTVRGTTGVYEILTDEVRNRTAAFVKPLNTRLKTVTIPKTVKINGYTYQITMISENAFRSCYKLQKVMIEKNVKIIEKNAFLDCKKLLNVKIKATGLKYVGKQAFGNIHKKAVIRIPERKYGFYKKLLRKQGVKIKAF